MGWYGRFGRYGGFAPYVPVRVRHAQAARKARELTKAGHTLRPVEIEGRAIATTFWGKAWCDHLEGYADFANRLPRGRTYVRNGSVIDLQLEQGLVSALVSGSDIYTVRVKLKPLAPARRAALAAECAGKIDSVVELLAGELSDGVMRVLCRPEAGLFPASEQLELSCSCPDGAWLCKHLAATLYAVGARLDEEPGLLFTLRGVDQLELVSQATGAAVAGDAQAPGGLQRDDLAEVFGIELESHRPAPARQAALPSKARRAAGTAAPAPRPRPAAGKPPSRQVSPQSVAADLQALVKDQQRALARLASAVRKVTRRRR